MTAVGVTVFGGAWPAFAGNAMPRGCAPRPIWSVPPTCCKTPSARAESAEKKARRDKAGRAWCAKGVEDKMFMDREERAENTAAREGRLAERLIGDRATHSTRPARGSRS